MANTSGKTSLTIRLTDELQEWLREIAAKEERSLSSVVERALKDAKAMEEQR